MPSSKGTADYGGTNSGDTAFIIICGALVLLMALPGIVLFYGCRPRRRFSCSRGNAAAATTFAVMWPLRRGRRFARAPRPVARLPFYAHASCVLNSSMCRWSHRLQEMHVHLHSNLCRCQLDLHNLADVRLLACLWAQLGWHKERLHWRRQHVLVLGRRQGYPLHSCLPACKIIICLPVCNFALSSELDRGRRSEACEFCIAST